MARWSEVRYARAGDGTHLAYQEAGVGTPVLLFLDGFVPIEDMDEEPRLAGALARVASFSRAIRFDRRGIVSSDPATTGDPPSLQQWLDDAESVLDAAGCNDAVVVGDRGGALMALGLAALRPRRVRSLVVINGYATFMASEDHPVGADPGFMAEARERLFDPTHPKGAFDIISHLAPSAAGDLRFRAWWDRAGRRGASPATARALRAVIEDLDLRALLPEIAAPVLVLHRSEAAIPSIGQGRYLADHLPEAHFVELPGQDAVWYVGETDGLLDEIERFVNGGHPHGPTGETLTVLFTDIVGSTELAAALGDRAWSQLFDRYESAAHGVVGAHGGVYVKSTGDGTLATFDGPVRAVQAAQRIQQRSRELDLQLRAGVHTGRVEPRGRDIAGIAVHVAARVLALACPYEVLLTATTADLLTGSKIELEVRGEYELAGVPGRWRVLSAGVE